MHRNPHLGFCQALLNIYLKSTTPPRHESTFLNHACSSDPCWTCNFYFLLLIKTPGATFSRRLAILSTRVAKSNSGSVYSLDYCHLLFLAERTLWSVCKGQRPCTSLTRRLAESCPSFKGSNRHSHHWLQESKHSLFSIGILQTERRWNPFQPSVTFHS